MNVGESFMPDALAANIAGGLSDDQRGAWRGTSRGIRKGELSLMIVFAVLGVLVLVAPITASNATWKPIIGVALLVIAAVLLWRAVTGEDRVTEDVRSGRVQSVDGAITKQLSMAQSGGSSLTTYYFDVAGQRFTVDSSDWYRRAPDAAYVRVFYMPASKKVVNLEVVPGPPVPDYKNLTPASVDQFTHQALEAAHSHSEQQLAEVRAQGQAMMDTYRAEMQQAAVPPPLDVRDSRPLASAVVGSWSNAFMTAVFADDGTVNVTMMGGRQQLGHWSVGSDGKLHSDALGSEGAADAWIRDDELTISAGEMALTFTRTAGG